MDARRLHPHLQPNTLTLEASMRTAIAFAVLATVAGSMWLTFDLLARAADRRPVHPWTL